MYTTNGQDDKQWYFKSSDNVLKGPFTLQELQSMLQKGELGETFLISKDKENWVEVQSTGIFKNEWMAVLPDNTDYGPFSLAALPELVSRKILQLETKITNPMSGEELIVSDGLNKINNLPKTNEIIDKTSQPLFPDFVSGNNSSQKYPTSESSRRDRSQSRIQQLELRIRQLEEALSSANAQLALANKGQKEQLVRHQQHISASEQRIRELSNTLDQVRREKEKLVEEINRLRNQESLHISRENALQKELNQTASRLDSLMRQLQVEQQEKNKAKDEVERLIQSTSAQLEAQRRQLQEKTSKYEQIQQQLIKLQTQLSQERHEAMHKENVFREKIKSLEKDLASTKMALQSANQRLQIASQLTEPQRVQVARLEKELTHTQELSAQFKAEAEKEVASLKEKINSLLQENSALNKQLKEILQNQHQQDELKKQEILKLQDAVAVLKTKNEELTGILAEKERELTDRTAKFESEIASLKRTISEQLPLVEEHKKLQELRSQLELLKQENTSLHNEIEKYKVAIEQRNEEYKKKELEFTARIKLLENENTTLRSTLKTAQQSADALRKSEELRQQLENARAFSIKIEEELKVLKTSYNALQEQNKKEMSEANLLINQLKEALNNSKMELEAERNKAASLSQKLEATLAEAGVLKKELERVKEEEKNIKLSYDAQENSLKKYIVELERRLEASQNEILSIKKLTYELQEAKDKAIAQLEIAQKELTEINKNYTTLKLESSKRETDLSLKIKELERELSRIQSANMTLQNELVQERQRNNQLSVRLQQNEKTFARLKELEVQNALLTQQLKEKEAAEKVREKVAEKVEQVKLVPPTPHQLDTEPSLGKEVKKESLLESPFLPKRLEMQEKGSFEEKAKAFCSPTIIGDYHFKWRVAMGLLAMAMLAIIIGVSFYQKTPEPIKLEVKEETHQSKEFTHILPQTLPIVLQDKVVETKVEMVPQSLSKAISPASAEEKQIDEITSKKKKFPTFDIAGVEIREHNEGKLIVFEEPIFKKRAEISETGKLLLTALAQELKPLLSELRLVIIGHTDSDALPPNSPFKDNKELSMVRADVAAQFIKKVIGQHNLDITLMGAGSENPPFSEETPENKVKNRTISILVIQK